MKLFFLFFSCLLFSLASFASTGDKPVLSCETFPPTTSLQLESASDGQLALKVTHWNGAKYAPVFSGILTSSDIDYLVAKSELVKKMGSSYQLPLDPSRCTQATPGTLICHSLAGAKIGDLTVSSYSLIVSKNTSVMGDSTFVSYQTNLWISHESKVIEIPNSYDAADCSGTAL